MMPMMMPLTLGTLRTFFGWCSIINIALLLYSFLMLAFAKEFIYKYHSKWFKISKERFDEIWYSFIGYYKISVFVFNIVPYFALLIITR